MGLEGRIAAIAGASDGIGAAIAKSLAAAGATVSLGARRTDRLESVAQEIAEQGGRAIAVALDVSDPDSVDRFFAETENRLGNADIVVSNAGVSTPGALEDLSTASIREDVLVNLLGPMYLARRAIGPMKQGPRGDLVFITSLNAALPRPLQVPYSATKTGLEAMVRTLQMELEGTGIRATSIRPGPTISNFASEWKPGALEKVMKTWKAFGIYRHDGYLHVDQIADAVRTVVGAPVGTHLGLVEITPEAPKSR